MDLRKIFVPKQKSSRKPAWKDPGSFPISKSLQEAIHRKHLTHRQWMAAKRHGQPDIARLNYTRERKKVAKLIRRAKRKCEKDIAQKCKNNPKVFWAHIRNKFKTKTGVTPLLEKKDDKNSIKFSDEDKANILQKQFSSVYTQEPKGTIPRLSKRTDDDIPGSHVTHDIHPRMLQELVDIIAEPISIHLNKTLQYGYILVDWKRAYVSPIYKKGAKNQVENYRPISLTSLVCKLIESF